MKKDKKKGERSGEEGGNKRGEKGGKKEEMKDSEGGKMVAAHFPMFQSRNRNCRDRLLFSMTSSSVTVMTPESRVAMPIRAKFLRNSQPRAPAPTRNRFSFCSFS